MIDRVVFSLGSRTIYVNVDTPNLGFPYFNFLKYQKYCNIVNLVSKGEFWGKSMLCTPSTFAFYLFLGQQLVEQYAQAEVRFVIIIAIIAIITIIAIASNIIIIIIVIMDGLSSARQNGYKLIDAIQRWPLACAKNKKSFAHSQITK